MGHSRRAFLQRSGVVGASAVGLGNVAAQQSPITRIFVIPRVEEFEDNYLGQWLQVTGTTEIHDQVVDECAWADWNQDETTAYDALLLDRRSEVPVSVELTAYGDGQQTEIRESIVFIINRVQECGSDWMALSGESVPRRAIIGEPAGPTVEGGDGGSNGGVGLGPLAAVSAVGAATVLKLLRGGDEE